MLSPEDESQNVGTIADGAALDALPYIDPADEEYEALALSLIEREMQLIEGRQVEVLEPLRFTSELFQKEYEQRTRREGPLPPLDLDTAVNSKIGNNEITDKKELEEAVKQARIMYEKERLREAQLTADKNESSVLWKSQIELLNQQHATLEQRLERQRNTVEIINSTRQQEQEGYGRELERGMRQFDEMVAKRIQLQNAIAQLEGELK